MNNKIQVIQSIKPDPAYDKFIEHYYRSLKSLNLPYRKMDNVAKLDKPRKAKRQKPEVPANVCKISKVCYLRKKGKCNAIYCKTAHEYRGGAL